MHHVRLVQQLLRQKGSRPTGARVGEVAAAHYSSVASFERDRAVIARLPTPVALAPETPGACLPIEVGGVSALVVRSGDDVRVFKNACRHRSTELVREACTKKALVCPYHGWTYSLAGQRIHLPHAETFGEVGRDRLIELPSAVRHGFVWSALEPFDLDAHLAPVAEAFSALDGLRMFRTSQREVAGNWKLIVDAFLDGYHIRHLHRDTIYRFFADGRFEAERAGPHIRAISARRALFEAPSVTEENVRQLVTPSYLVFPNTIVILHPDYVSVMTMTPLAPDRTRFLHVMFAPAGGDDAHWEKSFALIDEGVFAAEDLATVEAMQRGLRSGANDSVLFGELEHASLWFHEQLG